MDAVFEAEVFLGDQDRAHDLLRGLLVSTTDAAELSQVWRVYGRFCLRAGDRLKAAELAFLESLKYQANTDSLYALFGIYITTQRVKLAVSLLNEEPLGLVLRYAAASQRLLLRSVLVPEEAPLTDAAISDLLRQMVVRHRLFDVLPAVKAALTEDYLKRRASEMSVLEARVLMARKNWKAALATLQNVHSTESEISREISGLLAEVHTQLHDSESSLGYLAELNRSEVSSATPAELLDGDDVYTSSLVQKFRQGQLLLKRRRWGEALGIFLRLETQRPLATTLAAIAACHLHLGDFGACLEAAKKAAALDPMKADAWGLSSFAMLHLDMFASAEVCFNLYLDRLKPGPGAALVSSWLLIDLGFAWAARRPGVVGGGKAEACALQALRISGASPKVHWLLGESMVASKMTDRGVMEMLTAVQAYGKAASDDPEVAKTQREQVLLRALQLATSGSAGSGQLYETVKAAVIKHAPHLLGKVVTAMNEAVIGCIKLMLLRPSGVDELASVMMKNPAALTSRGVTLKDVKTAITVISESDYWNTHVLKHGCGFKARRFMLTVADNGSEESELEVGFTEDERPPASPKTKNKKKLRRKNKSDRQLSSEDEASAPSGSPVASPLHKRRRLLKKSEAAAWGSDAEDSPRFGTPTMEVSDGEEAAMPQRAPASYSFVGGAKENLRPSPERPQASKPASPAKPKPKARPQPRPEARVHMPPPTFTVPAPSGDATTTTPIDWSSEFGQVVRQALTWRSCPFRALGLSGTNATLAEVKKRWSRLILLLHPDKAPKEWRGVRELSDAAQAVNEARAECERRLTATAVTRPGRPEQGTFELMENNGARVVELRWQPPTQGASLVDKFTVLLRYPMVVTLASVNAGADPWLALSEVDPRYKHVFTPGADRLLVHVHATNAAGMSDPLVIDVLLRPGASAAAAAGTNEAEVDRMFEGLRHLAKNQDELYATLMRFSLEQLKTLLRCPSAARLSAPAPPPSGLGNKATLIERLVSLFRLTAGRG